MDGRSIRTNIRREKGQEQAGRLGAGREGIEFGRDLGHEFGDHLVDTGSRCGRKTSGWGTGLSACRLIRLCAWWDVRRRRNLVDRVKTRYVHIAVQGTSLPPAQANDDM